MCGILYVEDLRGFRLNQKSLDVSASLMSTRGPAVTISRLSRDKSRYFANAILPISPGHKQNLIKFPNTGDDVFAYNGELYDFPEACRGSGGTPTDTFHAHRLVKQGRFLDLLETPGFFSFIFRDQINDPSFELVAGTDLFGEKSLFYHFGTKFLLVSSSPEPIVSFLVAEKQKLSVNRNFVISYLVSRNLISGAGSFLNEVSRIPSGRVFRFSGVARSIVPVTPKAFEIVRKRAAPSSQPKTTFQDEVDLSFAGLRSSNLAAAFSGGIDSSVIVGRLVREFGDPAIPAITLDFGAKDPSAAATHQMAKALNLTNHVFHSVSAESYTEAFQEIIPGICAPLATHSVVSAFILNQLVASERKTVLFGGGGGDEIHGGYAAYRTMPACDSENSISEYSSFRKKGAFEHVFDAGDWGRLQRFTSISALKAHFLSLGFSRPDASLKASQWLDIQLNLSSSDLFPNDWVAGKFGIENRSPFVSLGAVTEALFSRGSIGADGNLLDKPELRAEYAQLFGAPSSTPKYGFSGFPNEAGFKILDGQESPLRLMEFLGKPLPFFADPGISRREAWKMMNLEIFLRELDSFSNVYFDKISDIAGDRLPSSSVQFGV